MRTQSNRSAKAIFVRRIILTLKLRLLLLWVFMLAVSVALAFVIRHVYQLGAEAQTEKTVGLAEQACELLRTEYPRAVRADSTSSDVVLMSAILNLTLGDFPGIEGGYWQEGTGFAAYEFPTHQGSEQKKDVPSTERSRIEDLVRNSLAEQATMKHLIPGARETVVLMACPVQAQAVHIGAWTMARVPTASGKAYEEVNRGLALLLGFVVISGIWLGWSFFLWNSRFRQVERDLGHEATERFREIAPTGDGELDRIVAVVNQFQSRLAAARERQRELGAILAQSERFAALGRMAAAVAHEVRNPIAAMRLKAENALAQGDRREAALRFIVEQIDRLDNTVRDLLRKAEPVRAERREVAIADWMAERMASFGDRAMQAGISVRVETELQAWRFDPVLLGRALDNLVMNALDHAPCGGSILVHVVRSTSGSSMILRVHDSGPGVPEGIEPRLFEPFVSGRANGTGLGLALVREIAAAHGGEARYVKQPSGACFEVEIP